MDDWRACCLDLTLCASMSDVTLVRASTLVDRPFCVQNPRSICRSVSASSRLISVSSGRESCSSSLVMLSETGSARVLLAERSSRIWLFHSSGSPVSVVTIPESMLMKSSVVMGSGVLAQFLKDSMSCARERSSSGSLTDESAVSTENPALAKHLPTVVGEISFTESAIQWQASNTLTDLEMDSTAHQHQMDHTGVLICFDLL